MSYSFHNYYSCRTNIIQWCYNSRYRYIRNRRGLVHLLSNKTRRDLDSLLDNGPDGDLFGESQGPFEDAVGREVEITGEIMESVSSDPVSTYVQEEEFKDIDRQIIDIFQELEFLEVCIY